MPDIAISQTSFFGDKAAAKITPVYLVIVEQNKTVKKFLATKVDRSPTSANCIGFYYEGEADKLKEKFTEIVQKTDSSNYVEIEFPWTKVSSIQNLIYKHKQTNK